MVELLKFNTSQTASMGVELELQLVDLFQYNLAMEAEDFLRRISEVGCPGEIKPEITKSMIEINSSVHVSYSELLDELQQICRVLTQQANQAHIGICGGGAHPFQKWKEQRIFPTERFSNLSEQYGYLAKQFTVFGQHIHIGCPDGDAALYLCHALARYIPHFIALSAASPFYQGVDTAFDCSRLAVISSFPLSGTPPWLLNWHEFVTYFEKMVQLGVVKSMKDFYWDIRPKPEYGTVELRICDTPLTVGKAADIAAYLQALSLYLMTERPPLSHDIYLTYHINRFRAARYGMKAVVIDPVRQVNTALADDILETCSKLTPYVRQLDSQEALENIKLAVHNHNNGAGLLREYHAEFGTLNDVVRTQMKLWMSE